MSVRSTVTVLLLAGVLVVPLLSALALPPTGTSVPDARTHLPRSALGAFGRDPTLTDALDAAAILLADPGLGLDGMSDADAVRARLERQALHVAAARDIAGLLHADGTAPSIATGAAVARVLATLQASGAPLPATPSVAHDDPVDAAVALLAARGHAVTAEERAALQAAWAPLPREVAEPLARFLDAFRGFDAATRDGFASAGMDAARVDLRPIVGARHVFLEATVALAEALAGPAGVASASIEPVDMPPHLLVDLRKAPDTRTVDYALTLDAGGNDTYRNNAGGSNLRGGACGTVGDGSATAAALVDLGGKDRYGQSARGCGVNGGGHLGAGFLLDAGGANDTYEGAAMGVNGGGWTGFGFLLDQGGDDVRNGTELGVNGGGATGAGLLIDLAGSDRYKGTRWGVNGGAFGGAGGLVDATGDDNYTAKEHGVNGGAVAGAGFLYDGAGKDLYQVTYSAVNGGAVAGAGFLADGGGNDLYISRETMWSPGFQGVNGGGYLGGVGLLVDASGNDRYDAGFSGVNGGGHLGVGLLVDGAGHDLYVATHTGTNGGATSGAGRLLDASGDDRYSGTRDANGGATSGSGLLVDGEGYDRYTDQSGGTGVDRTVEPKGTFHGAQMDL